MSEDYSKIEESLEQLKPELIALGLMDKKGNPNPTKFINAEFCWKETNAVKYEEDFILCSKIDEAMRIIPDENNIPIIGRKNYKEDINTEKLYEINL